MIDFLQTHSFIFYCTCTNFMDFGRQHDQTSLYYFCVTPSIVLLLSIPSMKYFTYYLNSGVGAPGITGDTTVPKLAFPPPLNVFPAIGDVEI